MRLVGASRWYTQLPFLLESVLAATIGVILAIIGLLVRARAVPGEGARPVLPSQSDRQDRLRRHHLHRRRAVPGGRRDGRCHGVRDAAPVRANGSDGQESAAKQEGAKAGRPPRSSRPIAKRRHNYSILDTYEAGVVLQGTEVKACARDRPRWPTPSPPSTTARSGCATCTSPSITTARWTNHAPRRNRKLLLHRKQIDALVGKIRDGNLTLVPLSLVLHRRQGQGRAGARARQAGPRQTAGHGPPDAATRDHPRTRPACEGHVLIGSLAGPLFALLSALGFGVSDFVGGIASRRVAALRVVLLSYPVALVLLTAWPHSPVAASPVRRCCGAGCAA